jgi:hypothetical protein
MDMFDCILIQINSNRKHMLFSVGWLVALLYLNVTSHTGVHHGQDGMVVGCTTTYAISAYHH